MILRLTLFAFTTYLSSQSLEDTMRMLARHQAMVADLQARVDAIAAMHGPPGPPPAPADRRGGLQAVPLNRSPPTSGETRPDGYQPASLIHFLK